MDIAQNSFQRLKTRHNNILKDNKPKKILKNWRPLTLLDTVYKIASGTIENSIKLVIDKIISKDQTCFIRGRYIG